jgi:type IV secretory pathway VirB10-like protein
MSVVRFLLLLSFAAFLAGCAASTPPLQAQENVSSTIIQSDRPATAEETAEANKPKPPAPSPDTAATPSRKDTMHSTTPIVGSAQWRKERAEDERKEKHLKEVIEGICRGC